MPSGLLRVAFACDTEDNHPKYVPGWNISGTDYDKNPASINWSWTQHWRSLNECFSSRGVPVTWLIRVDSGPVQDQMLVLFKDKILELISNGDEIGIHIHTWIWDSELSEWVQTVDPADETKIVLDSLNTFKRHLGFAPLSVRMGWNTMSNAIMRTLDGNGLLVDASAVPATTSPGKFGKRDNIFNWSRVSASPYHPNFDDYQSAGNMKILEMPISSLNSKRSNIFRGLVNRLSGKKTLLKLVPIARRFNLTPHNHLYITPWWSSSVYARIIKSYAEMAREKGTGFLVGTFHSCDILDPRTGKRNVVFERCILNVLREVLALKNVQVQFMTLARASNYWKELNGL